MPDASAAVAIVHARFPVESVLLMRRAERADDHWSGHWSFPGGRRDPQDADLVATALRELHEECGVSLVREDLERALPLSSARRREGPLMYVAPFVFHLESALDAVPDRYEAVEARWFPLDYLRDPANHRVGEIPNGPAGMLFPCIPLPEMPLWGFTYRILTEWLDLLPARDHRPEALRRVCDRLDGQSRAAALQILNEPWTEVPPLSAVELTPNALRILGLGFEPYVVHLAEE